MVGLNYYFLQFAIQLLPSFMDVLQLFYGWVIVASITKKNKQQGGHSSFSTSQVSVYYFGKIPAQWPKTQRCPFAQAIKIIWKKMKIFCRIAAETIPLQVLLATNLPYYINDEDHGQHNSVWQCVQIHKHERRSK